jgi:hypothetical protein
MNSNPVPKTKSSFSAWALAFWLTLGLRLALGGILAIATAILAKYIPPILSVHPDAYGKLNIPASLFGKLFLEPWVRWDAVHHLNLAMRGYFDISVSETVFYPMYAGLTRLAAILIGDRYILAGLIVSTMAAFFTFYFLKRIGDRVFGLSSGTWSAIVLAIYPLAFFLIAPYSESLFLAFTLGALFAAYGRRWWLAGTLAICASLTRGPGMATFAAFVVLAFYQWQDAKRQLPLKTIVEILFAIAAPFIGGFGFIAWRQSVGFPSISEVLWIYTRTFFVVPPWGVYLATRQWIQVFDLPTTLDILSLVFFSSILVLMLLRPKWRKWELIAFMAVSLLGLLSRGGVVSEVASLKSFSRYVLALFPAFLIIGDFLSTASRRLRFIYVLISSTLLLIASVMFTLWFFMG